MEQRYYYETPMWAVAILSAISVAVSVLFYLAFDNWEKWSGDSPNMLKWLFFAMSIVFFVAGIKPRNWKPWRYFYADKAGIHFPSECPETKNTEWLAVPWSRVGSIQKELFINRYKGPSIELLLDEQEINNFFKDVKLTKMFLGNEVREKGYFKVGYSNAFKGTDKAVKILNEYKSNCI